MSDDQPFVDHWPWDEPLSKVPAQFDIKSARLKLARRFNSRPPEAERQDESRAIERRQRGVAR